MKKTLISLSVLSAFAATGAANAGDVEIYGLINPSLTFIHSDSDIAGESAKNSFSMEEGKEFGSRWGIRTKERISDDLTISVTLESGFRQDTGALGSTAAYSSRIFDREAHIDLHTNFGKFTFGRMPLFGSVLGADGLFRAIDPLFANYTSAFGSGSVTASDWTRVDNAISYVSPTYAGFTGYAMYSLKKNSTYEGEESKAESDRYASLAVRYKGEALEAVLVADMTMYGSVDSKAAKDADIDNGFTVTLGGNYTFDNQLKLIAFAQYFKDQYINTAARAGVTQDGVNAMTSGFASGISGYGYLDGYGISLGANYPVAGGTLKGQVAYRDAENQDDVEFDRWFVALGYDYFFTKRTNVYVMTGYTQEKIEKKTGEDATPGGFEFDLGIVHRF